MIRSVLLASSLGLVSACASAPPPRPYVFPLRSPSTYPQDFLDRQSIVATYGPRHIGFDAAMQKRGDTLTLLGLTPVGSRAFLLKQTGTQVFFESYVPQELPFPPSYVLIDVHRVFFDGIGAPGSISADGEHAVTRDGEIITEMWKGGAIQSRTFTRADKNPPGTITITFEGDHVHFKNGWYGYELDITTRSHQLIEASK